MRVNDNHIKSSLYIYSSMVSAQAGERAGGSGFLVGISAGRENAWFIYAVTNVHVIGSCTEYPTIRVNTKDGHFCFVETAKSLWHYHPAGDDIAVYELRGLTDAHNLDIAFISPNEFLTPNNLLVEHEHIGPGDNTYMIGRFTSHEGSKINTPIIRFGNISLNPSKHDTITNPKTGHKDEVFLVESRSVGGYSGSAVFTYVLPLDDRGRNIPISTFELSPDTMSYKPFFLGVNIGHTRTFEDVVTEDTSHSNAKYKPVDLEGKRLKVENNSDIMQVSPAWKLQEILNMEVFAEVRKKEIVK